MQVSLANVATGYGRISPGGPLLASVKSLSGNEPASKTSSVPTGDILQISDAAYAALSASKAKTDSFTSVAKDARAVLDQQYKAARSEGTFATTDTARGGRFLDLSSLSDQGLAAIALDKAGTFSGDESVFAQAELGKRLFSALSPFDAAAQNGDHRGLMMGIKKLYEGMSPEVRDALGWNQAMLDVGDRIMAEDESIFGKLDSKSFIEKLMGAQKGGALKVDLSNGLIGSTE